MEVFRFGRLPAGQKRESFGLIVSRPSNPGDVSTRPRITRTASRSVSGKKSEVRNQKSVFVFPEVAIPWCCNACNLYKTLIVIQEPNGHLERFLEKVVMSLRRHDPDGEGELNCRTEVSLVHSGIL